MGLPATLLPLLRLIVVAQVPAEAVWCLLLVLVSAGAWAWLGRHRRLQQDQRRALAQAQDETQAVRRRLADALQRLQAADAARAEAEARAAHRAEILFSVSHEIRTPITAIVGFAELLSEEVGERQQEFTGYIRDNGQRLLTTLNAILDLARLEAGGVPLQLQPVDLGAVAESVVQFFGPTARTRGLTLRYLPAAAPRLVLADRTALERILQNLVGNALKYTEAGHVNVRVGGTEKAPTLAVEDTGIGIAASFLPHLFEPFRQETAALDAETEGSGLGLALTHRLVEALDGRIEVTSRKGEGSRFTVWLPPAAHAPAERPA